MPPFEREPETHPSYGVISLHNVSSSPGMRLFGSDLLHPRVIRLTISRAQLNRDLGRDWTFSKEELIEVFMSHAQFAEFITTPNMGTGTHCTLARVVGEGGIEPPPYRETERERARDDFRERLSNVASSLKKIAAEMESTVEDGKRPTKKQAEAMVKTCRHMAEHFTSNADFAAKQFDEAMDKTVAHAKGEVEAFMSHAIHSAGLAHLQSQAPQLLTEGQDENTP